MGTTRPCILALLAVTALGAGCGGGGGSSAETAAIQGTVTEASLGRLAVASYAAEPITVLAVDGAGEAVAVARAPGPFRLDVPTGRDYVLVFSDAHGIIGGMVHGETGHEVSAFAVPEGAAVVDVGAVALERRQRAVWAAPQTRLPAAAHSQGPDTDGDGIPDRLDGDDDNDGVPDSLDVSAAGRDRCRDHDNDGVSDDADGDLDNDGVANREDDYPRDFDNDGEDDDRDLDDEEDDADHPANPESGYGNPDTGRAVFLTTGCGSCHGPGGAGAPEAPQSIRNATPREVATVLAHGETDPDEFMPAYPDLVPSAADIAAFLRSAVPAPGPGPAPDPAPAPAPAVTGQAVYDANCRGCHRLGSLDSAGSAPDLSRAGALVRSRFTAGLNGHKGITLSAEEIAALGSFVDAH